MTPQTISSSLPTIATSRDSSQTGTRPMYKCLSRGYYINIENKPTMKNFFKLALTAAVGLVALASPAKAGSTMKDHQALWDAIEKSGTPILVNITSQCEDNWGGGGYFTFPTGDTALLICQDKGADVEEGEQATWTANDLDTLRHEAHHIVQDCLHGVKGDKILEPFFEGDDYNSFIVSNLSEEKFNFILERYDQEDHLIELEAFAVADSVAATSIADAVGTFCK